MEVTIANWKNHEKDFIDCEPVSHSPEGIPAQASALCECSSWVVRLPSCCRRRLAWYHGPFHQSLATTENTCFGASPELIRRAFCRWALPGDSSEGDREKRNDKSINKWPTVRTRMMENRLHLKAPYKYARRFTFTPSGRNNIKIKKIERHSCLHYTYRYHSNRLWNIHVH